MRVSTTLTGLGFLGGYFYLVLAREHQITILAVVLLVLAGSLLLIAAPKITHWLIFTAAMFGVSFSVLDIIWNEVNVMTLIVVLTSIACFLAVGVPMLKTGEFEDD